MRRFVTTGGLARMHVNCWYLVFFIHVAYRTRLYRIVVLIIFLEMSVLLLIVTRAAACMRHGYHPQSVGLVAVRYIYLYST